MKKIIICAGFIAALFFSCRSEPDMRILITPETMDDPRILRPFVITDHKNMASGGRMPEWVELWLNSSIQDVEALNAYNGRYVFISRNEGLQLNPLHLWMEGFSPEFDFPRLAAARIERRFASEATLPDNDFGAYYETLIRAASDAPWTGAVKTDDFWIRRLYPYNEEENIEELETWEFIILLTIEKDSFASQLDEIFEGINPFPSPTRDQSEAIDRVIRNFFTGF